MIKKSSYIKNLIPRSGSYDINNNLSSNNSAYDDSLQFKESLTTSVSSSEDQSLEKSKKYFKSTQSILKLFTDSKKSQQHDSAFYHTTRNNNRKSFTTFQKKLTILGMPLLYLTYFSAVYTFLAYGATMLLSIYFILSNIALVLIPLYILVVGYMAVTFLSFCLIFAIKKDRLNVITLWIIVMAIFILPEIGLNIVLVEATWKWSYHEYKLIMTTLIVRICLDIPCLIFVIYYHVSKLKHNKYLQDMLQPLKTNIINGEVLKIYNNVKLDSWEEPKHVIQLSDQSKKLSEFSPVPPASVVSDQYAFRPNMYIYKFNKNQPIHLKQSESSKKYKNKCRNDEEALINSDDKNSPNEYDKNSLHLVWGQKTPTSQYSSETPQFTTVEEQKVTPLFLKNDMGTGAIELRIAIENHKRQFHAVPIMNMSGSSTSLNKIADDDGEESSEENSSFLRIEEEVNVIPGIKTNPIYENSELSESGPRSHASSLLKRTSLSLDHPNNCDDTNVEIPILYEGQVLKCSLRNDTPVSFKQFPGVDFEKPNENVNEPFMAFKSLASNPKSKIVDLSNHHLYLPPAPTITEKAEENSTLIENTINSTTTNNNNSNNINNNPNAEIRSNEDISKNASHLLEKIEATEKAAKMTSS